MKFLKNMSSTNIFHTFLWNVNINFVYLKSTREKLVEFTRYLTSNLILKLLSLIIKRFPSLRTICFLIVFIYTVTFAAFLRSSFKVSKLCIKISKDFFSILLEHPYDFYFKVWAIHMKNSLYLQISTSTSLSTRR